MKYLFSFKVAPDQNKDISTPEVKMQKKTKEKSRKRKPRKSEETIVSVKDSKTPGSPRTKFPPIVLLKHKK